MNYCTKSKRFRHPATGRYVAAPTDFTGCTVAVLDDTGTSTRIGVDAGPWPGRIQGCRIIKTRVELEWVGVRELKTLTGPQYGLGYQVVTEADVARLTEANNAVIERRRAAAAASQPAVDAAFAAQARMRKANSGWM